MNIFVLHENDEWLPPFREAFEAEGLPYKEWHLDQGEVPFDEVPPGGIYFSRMSASAHSRGHDHAPVLAQHLFQWLEGHGRRVINGSCALTLEMSKLAQYAALQEGGITVPRTRAIIGKSKIIEAAHNFGEFPFILKPNRGGKGLGVQLFQDLDGLKHYLNGPVYKEPADGTWLIQQYIEAPESFITRAEFIGGRFHYAVKVDTSKGFEICPADVCSIEGQFCPTNPLAAQQTENNEEDLPFQIIKNFSHPLIERIEAVLAANSIEVAGVEFIRDRNGNDFVYDINTNTNYNSAAERAAGINETAPLRLARFLGEELKQARAQGVT